MSTIRRCTDEDFDSILDIINAAAQRYHGVIPDDCWHEPYLTADHLRSEMESGVDFWGMDECDGLTAVMGLQGRRDVILIRHAYVLPNEQGKGIGSALLRHLRESQERPTLIGTWADATWAITFYQRHGFTLAPSEHVPILLNAYWSISQRQIETSVVLSDSPLEGLKGMATTVAI